ncbi:MAG: signal recognition particle protein [Caldilineales bacterium]|nr:signal recognition particle protein [Caldilineales bacterium]MDW8317394.1 signal recognition particle protein [Anaerolineae bacterium]
MFETLTEKLQTVFDNLSRRGKLTEADVDAAMREVRLALLEADVNYKVVKDLVARVKERAVGAEVMKSLTPAQQVVKIVHEELIATLGQPAKLDLSGPTPHVVMLVGLQGSGKTTTAAKLALHLRKSGQRPLLVAADTYRPAAIHQLEVLGKQLDIPVHSEGDKVPPPQICANAVRRARESAYTVVIMDTAGRLQINEDMMRELEQIKQLTKPQEVLLVADAMTGQQAVNVAKTFHERVGLTGLILTKMDGDARGGAAISMREVTNVPIKFVGVGEKVDALEVFHPDRMAGRILGMGDVLSLIEKAQATMDEEKTRSAAQRLMKGEFDLEDFLGQMQQMRKMGPLSQLLDMIPGMGRLTKEIAPEVTDKQMKQIEAIISSMTREERRRPEIINASRKRRIARGSGTTVQDVNELLSQFKQAQRLMKQLAAQGKGRRGGRFPGFPGLPLG